MAKPVLVQRVCHLVYEPRWGEYLCTSLGTLGLSLLLFEHTGLDYAGICACYCFAGDFILCCVSFSELFVFAISPDDVLASGAVCEEGFQNRAWVASLEALDEAISERGGRTAGGYVIACLSNVVLRSCTHARTLSKLLPERNTLVVCTSRIAL